MKKFLDYLALFIFITPIVSISVFLLVSFFIEDWRAAVSIFVGTPLFVWACIRIDSYGGRK